jgi:hypothetical protein
MNDERDNLQAGQAWWKEWRAVVDARLANLDHSVSETNTRLAVIETNQENYMHSVNAIRNYFDGSLRALDDKMGRGLGMLQAAMERQAEHLKTATNEQALAKGGLGVVQAMLPLVYTLFGALVAGIITYFIKVVKP